MLTSIKREEERKKRIYENYRLGVRVQAKRIGIDLTNSNNRSSNSRSINKRSALRNESSKTRESIENYKNAAINRIKQLNDHEKARKKH